MKTNFGQSKNDQSIRWTDVIFVPSALVGGYILTRWLSMPLAMTVSVVVHLLFFALFEPRGSGFKRFVVGVIVATIITFTAVMIFKRAS
jgi:hypothetical protein